MIAHQQIADKEFFRTYITLTPFIPLSLRGRGGRIFLEEGLTPLLDTPKEGVGQAKPQRVG